MLVPLPRWLRRIPWSLLVVGSVFPGLAPFTPRPHLVEKLDMLLAGELIRLVDWFDLIMHGAFPVLLAWRLADAASRRWGRRR